MQSQPWNSLLILVCGAVVTFSGCGSATPTKIVIAEAAPNLKIESFKECTEAGYLVMKTLPARCRTPDGRVFTEGQHGLPTVDNNLAPHSIDSFDECVAAGNAIRRTLPASCKTVDGRVFTDQSSASWKGTPQKAPPLYRKDEPACKNSCGNGVCEEIVCMAVGCPCPESSANCPSDCRS